VNFIELKGITKSYRIGFLRKRKIALEKLNLEVEKGEAFGYLGPNGAGKTTTLKILLNLVRPDAGSATIMGRPCNDVSIKSKVGFLPEHPYFYDYLSGKELLEFYANFFGLDRSQKRKRIADLLDIVSLSGSEGIALRKYSKGMLQRIGIAQTLINDPDILFFDEPLSGLDPIGRKEVKDIILGLKGRGKTIFFCSHVLPDVEMICDRVAILNKGHLVAVGDLESLLIEDVRMVDIEFKGLSREAIELIKAEAIRSVEQDYRVRVTVDGGQKVMEILRVIDRQGGSILSVMPQRKSLEELFVNKLRLEEGDSGR